MRQFLGLVVVLGLVSAGQAQPGRAEIVAKPAVPPTPSLRYELLPPGRDRTPGNGAIGYARAIALQPAWPKEPALAKKQADKLDQWDQANPQQLPLDEVEEFLKAYRAMFRAADEAARCERCDWEMRLDGGQDDIALAITTVQSSRELARALSLRVKLEIGRGRFAEAVRAMQTGFQLARDVGQSGTMIHMLVGIAITQQMIARVEDLIRQPGAPNMYWALTMLPRPFIDPRLAFEGESRLTRSFIPNLKMLESGPVTEAVAQKCLADTFWLMATAQNGPGENDPLKGLGTIAMTVLQAPQAKKDLAARGWAEKDLAEMPAAQAIILQATTLHREMWDDQVKLFALPYPAAAEELTKIRARSEKIRKEAGANSLVVVIALLFPAAEKVFLAHTRVERRLALLRSFEAIRWQTATQGGTYPAQIADVTVAPVPADPVTGKPFVYSVAGNALTLSAIAPGAEKANVSNAFEYVWKKE